MALKLKPLRKVKSEIIPPPKIGEIVEGKVVAQGRQSLFLDLGAKGIGIIYGIEFQKAKDILKNLKTGESISAKVINLENEDGYRELSAIDASRDLAWKELHDFKEKNKSIEVKISKVNKGGLISEVKGIPAFLPVSHLRPQHYPKIKDGNTSKIARALQKFIGQSLTVKIIDLEQKKGKLILSEKASEIEPEEAKETEKDIIKNYQVGDIVEGKITGVTNFGAFVELKKGIEGLLYSSEISKKEKPENILKTGQKIKAKIIKIIDNRIYLSLKT